MSPMDTLSMLSISNKIIDTVISTVLLTLEMAAQLSLGQMIFRFVDRFLWIVEKTAQWSLPPNEIIAEENGKSFGKMELVRPLPWPMFLFGLILLRIFRVALNIATFLLGYPKVETGPLIKFVQKVRRRLRTIKSTGMKNMRQRQGMGVSKDNGSNVNEGKWRSAQLIKSIQMTLSSLSCLDGSKLSPSPPPTRIKVHHNHESTPTPEEKSTTESAISPTHEDSKRKYSELSSEEQLSEDSEEETIQAKIDRLVAANDSINDDDFNPADLSSSNDDDSSTSGESSISVTELQEIQAEAKSIAIDYDRLLRLTGVSEVMKDHQEKAKNDCPKKSTGVDEKIENPSAGYTSENSEEQQDYYSPFKAGEDGETAFYSPISSTSASPDRMVPISEKNQQPRMGVQTSKACQNGELSANTEHQISDSADKTTNGHAEGKSSVPTKIAKFHNRGKRASHVSRKKK